MAINTTDIDTLYTLFLNKTSDEMLKIYKETNMEDEWYAQALGTSISSAMENSVRMYGTIKQGLMIDKQVLTEEKRTLDVAASTALKDEQKNFLLLQQTTETKRQDKLVADTSFVDTQKAELIASVTWNNKIKALDSYADMIGTMGAGGLKISSAMWTKFFSMVQELHSSGTAPTDFTITVAS